MAITIIYEFFIEMFQPEKGELEQEQKNKRGIKQVFLLSAVRLKNRRVFCPKKMAEQDEKERQSGARKIFLEGKIKQM